jgi:hypothetical protein
MEYNHKGLGANTLLGPNLNSLVFCLKNNGLVNQDEMVSLDWLFNKKNSKLLIKILGTKKCHIILLCMCIYKMNIKYPKTLFLWILNNKSIGYIILKMFLGILHSLDLSETYTNVSIIYLKHYCKSTLRKSTLT